MYQKDQRGTFYQDNHESFSFISFGAVTLTAEDPFRQHQQSTTRHRTVDSDIRFSIYIFS